MWVNYTVFIWRGVNETEKAKNSAAKKNSVSPISWFGAFIYSSSLSSFRCVDLAPENKAEASKK